ncbi:MAG: DUF72 domain-containing protein [Candidatus Hydrogenedentota bacterium]|nr:MAG: DUF72 domain-containing protein [Candidatus Hydrogenedentota bacterium]
MKTIALGRGYCMVTPGKNSARIRVGVAGWYYPDWQGVVYPSAGKHARDHLRYLAGFVDVIEINNTFYRPPETSDVANWCGRVADIEEFAFTIKLWQRFTHSRGERWRPSELKDFLRRVRPVFDSGLGKALLAQFPHSFHRTPENTAYLSELLGQIQGFPVAVELRHYTWNSSDAFSMLEELGAGMCSIDQPMFRGSLGPLDRVTGGLAYIRLHGRNRGNWFNEKAGRDERYDYLYSDDELAPWIESARRMAERAREVYVIANNHFRGQAVCNAIMFKASLLGRRMRAPAALLENFPVLKAHADPDAPVQETLF